MDELSSSETEGTGGEQIFIGQGVSPGVARGLVCVLASDEEEPPVWNIEADEIPSELARFETALIATRKQILDMQARISEAIGARDAGIFDAHLLVVDDCTLLEEVKRIIDKEHFNIEHVFFKVAMRYARTLSEIDDPYLRERALDINDVMRRVLRNLMGKASRSLDHLTEPHIIIAKDLTPSETVTMDRDLVLGFATDAGGRTSHTAIMAASLNIPAIVGLHDITSQLRTGDHILLDGYEGKLYRNPSEQTLWEYGTVEIRREAVEESLFQLRDTPSLTRDGKHIILSANIELPQDLDVVLDNGAEGIGLYRTEFFYLNKEAPPTEEEQYENYRLFAEAVHPHSLIIRTLDIGGDKLIDSVHSIHEANPFLGWRAIRFCIEQPQIFKPQLRAILRASAHGKVSIMYPMISGLAELKRANAILEECRAELRAEGVAFNEDMPVGAMIEIPSAALTSDQLIKEVDYFSIGTNDLIQYTIAVDRLNERISNLYVPTHPAILRLIRTVTSASHAAGKWTGLCGEIAGDITLTPMLIGLGVDELSVGAGILPRVKRAIQSLESGECEAFVEELFGIDDAAEIQRRCKEMASLHYPELFE